MVYEIALISSVLCFGLTTAAFARSSAFSIFHPLTFYMAFHGFIFVFRPIVAYFSDFDFVYRVYQFTPSLEDKITVICASNLGFLIFAATCWRAGNRPMVFKIDSVAMAERVRLTPLFFWVALICVPIGAYSLSIVWNSAADTGVAYSGMVRDAGTGVSINTETNGYLVEAQLMLTTCATIVAWLFRFRLIAIFPMVLFVVFRAGTGGRGPFITALCAVSLLYLYERRRHWPNLLFLVALPPVILLFSAVGSDRGEAIRRTLGNDTASEVFGRNRANERFLEGMDFANMEYFEYLVYVVPQRSGTYAYFNDVLQVFTEPIPRVLWKDKPIGAPFARIKLFDYGNPIGMTSSLPGAGWYSLGWLGVIIWSAFCGWALGALYRRYVEGAQSSFQTLAYMIFVANLVVSYRDGQLVTVFRQGLFFMAPIGLWWSLARLMGVPTLTDVRARLASRKPKKSGRPTAKMGQTTFPNLPAPVARRRLELAADQKSGETP